MPTVNNGYDASARWLVAIENSAGMQSWNKPTMPKVYAHIMRTCMKGIKVGFSRGNHSTKNKVLMPEFESSL